jgi:integrase
MAKVIARLTEARCRRAGVGLHPDGDGLYLQVRSATARSWLYRYMIAAKAREMGLGAYPATTLEIARSERDRFKRLRQAGEDPIEVRHRERNAVQIEQAKATKFSRAALEYLALKAPQWGNEKHRKQWLSTLKTYVEPVLGELPVQSIEPSHVLKVLEPIWLTKSETATRVRSRIEMILDYCSSMNYRKGENPARWRGCLKDLLPALDNVVETKHHPALPHAEIPSFMAELRAIESVTARALEFVILTAVRANEALKALPAEVNHTERTWTVPKIRMKGRKGKKKEHRVPLSSRALKITQAVRS